jgi:hypothetical protein
VAVERARPAVAKSELPEFMPKAKKNERPKNFLGGGDQTSKIRLTQMSLTETSALSDRLFFDNEFRFRGHAVFRANSQNCMRGIREMETDLSRAA